jgi:hypothetical protein
VTPRKIKYVTLTDRTGKQEEFCVEIDDGAPLIRAAARLANKLRSSHTHQKVASAADGVIRVWRARPVVAGWIPWQPSAHSTGTCVCGREPHYLHTLGQLRCGACVPRASDQSEERQ